MKQTDKRVLGIVGMVAGIFLIGCCGILIGLVAGSGDDNVNEPPRNAQIVTVLANSSIAPWIINAANNFNQAELEIENGKTAYVQVDVSEAGQAVSQIISNESTPDLWIPDELVWANIAAERGNGQFQGDCRSIASSPLVIAMWQPVAESLGWPGREIGWLDVGSLAADPSAWAYYSGGQFGDSLRLGHTHPGLSGSGASTLLAIVQAAQSKSGAVTVDEIQQPIVQASVGTFEGAVSWFSSDTESLGTTMSARGLDFLGAAVMYESTVFLSNRTSTDNQLVVIYPFEGTFVASHPACLHTGADGDVQAASQLFRDFLLRDEEQESAFNRFGLRPVSAKVEMPASLNNGFNASQPTTIFGPPSVDAVYAVQDVWQTARKDVNLVMLMDVSGSMSGGKIAGMREAAVQFVEQMGDDDLLTLVTFSHELNVVVDQQPIGDARPNIINTIQSLSANGDTALYDAIGFGADLIEQTQAPETSNALVVLTDGLDTASFDYGFDETLIGKAVANDTTVFTIAYGSDADEQLLGELANRAFGNYYQGDEADIAGIYEEMSAAFGGNLGVGR